MEFPTNIFRGFNPFNQPVNLKNLTKVRLISKNTMPDVHVICDPTYIGANAGMCMEQFKGVNPNVIRIE